MSSKKSSAAATAPTLRIDYLPLDQLMRWPGNPKEHAEGAIAASVQRFGFRDPLAIDEASGRLIAGHGRLTVLERAHSAGQPAPQYVQVREDGMWLVPVTRGGSFADESEASAYLIAHNRTGELGGWNDDLLAGMLGNLDEDLRGIAGFDLDAFVQEQTAAAPPLPPSEFLNDLIGTGTPAAPLPPGAPVAAATLPSAPPAGVSGQAAPGTPPAAAAPTITTPPAAGGEEYVQLVYVVPVSRRPEVLAALKHARSAFGVDTAPDAFLAVMHQYAQQNGVTA
ncbi:hypothetical protein [Deinococcus hohokamensis]|uniref:ParB/Sulfiredoxin domain-containing protein n=1 Tax=Deinococcus hohokamensis TaxID=309883 RepID=A0ABV9I494_9DEIO